MTESQASAANRRSFLIKGGAIAAGTAAATTTLSVARGAHAYGSDAIKVTLIGCGGRGTGAAEQAMNTSGGDVRLVAMADAFEDRLAGSEKELRKRHGNKIDVKDSSRFTGLDAYKRALELESDLVILASPPGFRPLHFEAAVEAGKNVFAEKPVACDAPGVRRFLAAGEKAKQKGLAVQVGLQRHHEQRYQETIAKLHEGAIGKFVMARAYWNSSGVWVRNRKPDDTELSYQANNWYYFNWLSGDHINEQHIHNLDVINWVMQDYPVEAQGAGGREVRAGKEYGQIYDHHVVEYTYANGCKLLSMCRHQPDTWGSVSEHVHGTKGYCDVSAGKIYDLNGELIWKSDAKAGHGHQEEHHDLFAALRRGETPNEAEFGAKSTMTAILGRMATYSGKVVKWKDAINSDHKLADYDAMKKWDDPAPVVAGPDGFYPVPVPGEADPLKS